MEIIMSEPTTTTMCVEKGLLEKPQEVSSLDMNRRSGTDHIPKQKDQPPQKRNNIFYHLYTIWLFTRSDIKTIILPSTLFAIISASSGPVMLTTTPTTITILQRIPITAIWVWSNLLPFAIDNQRQTASIIEDSENKPWRPLPSKRITKENAATLMLFFYCCAFILSIYIGGLPQCMTLMGLGYWYNDLHGADSHCVIRNLINASGYLCFTSGALEVISNETIWSLQPASYQWMLLVGLIVLTTVQAQDMADQEGDRLRGRMTVPLVIGDGAARYAIAVSISLWSFLGPAFWQLSAKSFGLPCVLAACVSVRFLCKRSEEEDKLSFRLYNVWVVSIYLLPLCKRLEEVM